MGWTSETVKNAQTIVGPIGDPLGIYVEARFDGEMDWNDHTWLCQIRENVMSAAAITLNTRYDSFEQEVTTDPDAVSEDNPDGTVTVIKILFDLANTSVLKGGVEYVYGVKAVEGAYAPFTLIAKDPVAGYNVVPREAP